MSCVTEEHTQINVVVTILTFKNWNFDKICSKSGLLRFFGPILMFYTKNSPQNLWSTNYITVWKQNLRKARTPCIFHAESAQWDMIDKVLQKEIVIRYATW